MKTNAIVRIIVYSLLAIVLTGVLLAGLGMGSFINLPHSGNTLVDGEASIDAAQIRELDIDWAAGSITVITADIDQIVITESGEFEEKDALIYNVKGKTLSIDYTKASNVIGSIPSKDLIITVPKDQHFSNLDIDGAALQIQIDGLNVDEVNLDGADLELSFDGALQELECDGADCRLDITCRKMPTEISVDGADCSVVLYLPAGCGFEATLNGLGCDFHSVFDHHSDRNSYYFGDKHCKIEINGLDCGLEILALDESRSPLTPEE